MGDLQEERDEKKFVIRVQSERSRIYNNKKKSQYQGTVMVEIRVRERGLLCGHRIAGRRRERKKLETARTHYPLTSSKLHPCMLS